MCNKTEIKETPKCHICGNDTEEDYTCESCGEYMCNDCDLEYIFPTEILTKLPNKCQSVY